MLLEEAWGCRQGAVAIGWSELRVTSDHVIDRGGPSGSDGPSRSISLYKQSSFPVTWAVRSTQYSTLHLLVTLSNTLRCYLSIVYTGTPTDPRDYRSPAVSRDTGRYTKVIQLVYAFCLAKMKQILLKASVGSRTIVLNLEWLLLMLIVWWGEMGRSRNHLICCMQGLDNSYSCTEDFVYIG
jgi:hypothetical protein